MPDIDPTSLLTRTDSISNPAALLSNKSLPNGTSTSTPTSSALGGGTSNQKGKQQQQQQQQTLPQTAPRVDLEPLYGTLKGLLGEGWRGYAEAVGRLVLGQMNQGEFSRRVDPLLLGLSTGSGHGSAAAGGGVVGAGGGGGSGATGGAGGGRGMDEKEREKRLHAHNAFIAALLCNASTRDPPPEGVAVWVSATEREKLQGREGRKEADRVEGRLKVEVMGLPARERHRLKGIGTGTGAGAGGEGWDEWQRGMREERGGLEVRVPEVQPGSAGGFNKTNWELEIRKRYAQPLFSETADFPDTDSIAARMIPICYEEGVAGGAKDGCAEFMSVATETFVKEALTDMFLRLRSNAGHNSVMTHKHKKRLEKETEIWEMGKEGVSKSSSGMLPVEEEEARRRRPLEREDLVVAVGLGDQYFSHLDFVKEKLATGAYFEGDVEMEDVERKEKPKGKEGPRLNGDGVHIVGHDPMMIDGEEGGWQGGADDDMDALDSALDDVLSI